MKCELTITVITSFINETLDLELSVCDKTILKAYVYKLMKLPTTTSKQHKKPVSANYIKTYINQIQHKALSIPLQWEESIWTSTSLA
jgi:hypothetical protein